METMGLVVWGFCIALIEWKLDDMIILVPVLRCGTRLHYFYLSKATSPSLHFLPDIYYFCRN